MRLVWIQGTFLGRLPPVPRPASRGEGLAGARSRSPGACHPAHACPL
jgi:hypothetical protein